MEFRIWVLFENVQKIQVWWKSAKTYAYLWEYVAEFFLEWEIFQSKVVEKT